MLVEFPESSLNSPNLAFLTCKRKQGLNTHSLQGQDFPQRHNCASHSGQKYLDEVSDAMGFLEGGDHEGGTTQDAPDCLPQRWSSLTL